MVELSVRNLSSDKIHDLLHALEAMKRNWETVRNILDEAIEARDVSRENAHFAKDVEDVMKGIGA